MTDDRLVLAFKVGRVTQQHPWARPVPTDQIAPASREYEEWWSRPMTLATLPARLVIAAGLYVYVAIFGMH